VFEKIILRESFVFKENYKCFVSTFGKKLEFYKSY